MSWHLCLTSFAGIGSYVSEQNMMRQFEYAE